MLDKGEDVAIAYQNKQAFSNQALIDFRLKERYNASHKHLIYDLYLSVKNHSPKVRHSLKTQFANILGGKSMKALLVKANGIPANSNEINSKHLSKLKRDIAIQLGIIDNI